MRLLAVSIGDAKPVAGKTSGKSGIDKRPVDHPVMIDREGLAGDRIINRKYHGGPDQAVYIEGSLDYDWWRSQLGRDLPAGTFGENLLIDGLDNRDVAVGDRFRIGDVLLEVTSARTPCATFAAHMEDPLMVKRYAAAARPGAYARVLEEGVVRAGDAVEYIRFVGDRVGLPELMRSHGKRQDEETKTRFLAAPIGERLRAMILAR
ncbi:MOSC domain-containing protein YiiM [Rhizobium sp. SG_E_25_P2]|uniref:MOSC domain-containing protein n=1 Tax=Rhizobium sp. SG_E_25_P2 TaxID=2879942 RepID=UPI002474491A|nr:MOSC domain-containing protein [Rhizobium sp. SG_E_25_P2]MDH6264774.1 MOSC domain-containing protein YiiM [Rhizobium sp. SG_E_25_P2]